MPKFALIAALLLAPLPFLAAGRTTPVSSKPSAPASGGLVLCDGQADALRFVLKPGGKAEREILIENPATKALTITSVESSCECLTLVTPVNEIKAAPNAPAKLRVAIDLCHDRDNIRGFAPELRLFGEQANAALTVTFDVEVRP